jgi:Hemerythrin HHE cation binding domain.
MTNTLDTAADNATGTGLRPAVEPGFGLVAVDLYRDIHKGIRAELFAITATAGNLDPTDRSDRSAFADHVTSVAAVLESHAHHEDAVIDPALEEHFPGLAERVRADHEALERRVARIVDLAAGFVAVDSSDDRRLAHLLHLELAGFTSAYLVHQDLEEREIMPSLERRLGVDAMAAMHGAIVGSIPPDELARSLAFMLPAMNVFDRVEMLSGIRAAAPAPAFDAMADLARSVLRPTEFAAVAQRLGLV